MAIKSNRSVVESAEGSISQSLNALDQKTVYQTDDKSTIAGNKNAKAALNNLEEITSQFTAAMRVVSGNLRSFSADFDGFDENYSQSFQKSGNSKKKNSSSKDKNSNSSQGLGISNQGGLTVSSPFDGK